MAAFRLRPVVVKRIRVKVGLTQGQLAEIMSVSVAAIRSWENGNRLCGGTAAKLLRVIDKDPDIITMIEKIKR